MMTLKNSKTKTSPRERALIAAEDLIETKGYVNVRARDIAGKAGISVGTLYHHFPKGKMEIVLEITQKYSDVLGIPEFLANPKANLEAWLRKDLRLSQQKRAFITAMEIEAMSRPAELKALFTKEMNEQLRKSSGVVFMMMQKFAGKKISSDKALNMVLVLKTLIRRHIVYGNIFGSDDKFIKLLLKIIQALVEENEEDEIGRIEVDQINSHEEEDELKEIMDVIENHEEEEATDLLNINKLDYFSNEVNNPYNNKYKKDEHWITYEEVKEMSEVETEQAIILEELYRTLKRLNVKYNSYPLFPKLLIEDKQVIGLSFNTRIFHWRPKSGEILVDIVSKLISLQTLIMRGFEDIGLKRLPKSIGNLHNLEYLDLSENTLSSLPESIGNLKSLTYLDLSENMLDLPSSLGNLTSLRKLYLLIGKKITYPEGLLKLKSLKIFR